MQSIKWCASRQSSTIATPAVANANTDGTATSFCKFYSRNFDLEEDSYGRGFLLRSYMWSAYQNHSNNEFHLFFVTGCPTTIGATTTSATTSISIIKYVSQSFSAKKAPHSAKFIKFCYWNSANPNGLSSIQQSSSSNSHRDVGIASNPLLLAASAAAASNSANIGSGANGMVAFGANANAGIGSTLQNPAASSSTSNQSNQHLLARFMQPTLDEYDLAQLDRSRADR